VWEQLDEVGEDSEEEEEGADEGEGEEGEDQDGQPGTVQPLEATTWSHGDHESYNAGHVPPILSLHAMNHMMWCSFCQVDCTLLACV
jgi:hypothetical protein